MSRTKRHAVTHCPEVSMLSRIDPAPWGSCSGDLSQPEPETLWLSDSFAAQTAEMRRIPVEDWPDELILELSRRLLSLDE